MSDLPPLPAGAGFPIVDATSGEFLSTAVNESLSATFVRFLDENGDPLVGKLVTITVNSTTGEIDDITSEDL